MPTEEDIELGSQEDSEEEDSDDEDDSEGGSEEGGGSLVFPSTFTKGLAQILLSDRPVPVREVKVSNKEEKMGLAYSLWAEGYVTTASIEHSSAKKQKA